MTVTGSISDASVSEATLSVNNTSQTVTASGSVSEQQIMRCPAGGYENTIKLSVSGRNCGYDSTTYTCTPAAGEASDLWVRLTWDNTSSGSASTTDIDLHVFEPGNEQVYFMDKTSDNGELDVDDTNGYGPENYTNTDASAGTYTIWVKCYRGCDTEGTSYTLSVTRGNESATEYTGTFTTRSTSTSECSTACDERTVTLY